MIKAVFLDMDGTVISHKQGKVLESTKDAICQLRERGIKVFAATGRHILEMEELDERTRFGYEYFGTWSK